MRPEVSRRKKSILAMRFTWNSLKWNWEREWVVCIRKYIMKKAMHTDEVEA